VVVTDELAPGCAKSIGDLAVGASTTYSCTVAAVTQGFTNVAAVVGYFSTVQVTDEDPSTVQIAKIDLRKQAEGPDEREISYGTDVSFEIFVENTGEVTLNDVEVTDEQVPGCGQYIGTLEPGGTYSYSCVAPAVTEGFTNTAIVTGVVDNFQVSDEDPSTVKIRLYELYFPYLSGGPLMKYNLTLGYEDLRLDQQNDFDYNDWVVSVVTNLSFAYLNPQTVNLRRIAFTFTPKARGALLSHEYRLKFAPNTFGSDGTATVIVRDGQGNVLSNNQYPFVSSQTNDFQIFDCTCNALPNGYQFMNTNEGTGPYPTQRTAEFIIDFNSEATFVLADYGPHGEGLFFNPYLRVTGWGSELYDVGIDDVRTLVAPISNWKWAEEGARIDYAYPTVTYIGSPNMFTFPNNWWQVNTSCVYGDGIVCVIP
jgi:plastocyanin